VGERVDGDELGALAGRGGEGGDAAFESRDALLEDVDGGLSRVSVSATLHTPIKL